VRVVPESGAHGSNGGHAGASAVVVAAAPYVPAQPPPRPVTRAAGYDGPENVMDMWVVAGHLADASILPRHFHKQAANVFAVMMQARAANLPVFTALQHMNVIDGRVEESAELVRAMLLAAGYGYRVVATSDTAATVEVVRPGEEPQRVTFTMVEAVRMGLAGKDNWKKSPNAMLVARATTRAASWCAPEVTMGLANLSHAELGEGVPEALAHLRADEDEGSPTVQAAACWAAARLATEAGAVRQLGAQARAAGLLAVPVEGTALQTLLVERLAALTPPPAVDEGPVGEVLPCGCEAEQVLAAGRHTTGCPA
jgi:hypothetical protein